MKKILYSLLAGVMMFSSCSDFTDITQKGKNLLSSTEDLELLLNKEYDIWQTDMRNLTGVIYNYSSLAAVVNAPTKTRSTLIYTYDDSESSLTRFEILTTSDGYYQNLYNNIGRVANPILQKIDAASGSEAKRKALKAEALTLRAYSHFMLLQKYAKAYNASTAASDPAIAYMTEDVDIQTPQPKKTVQEAYDLCLKDIDDAIALDAMPVKAINNLRLNKPAMYAVKAQICLNMQKYDEAVAAAKSALALNNSLYRHYENLQEGTSQGGVKYYRSCITALENPEVYFGLINPVYYTWVNPNLVSMMEPTYATYFLYPKYNDAYLGTEKEDYSASLGIPGWIGGFDYYAYFNESGLQTSSMYLVIAEALIKSGKIDEAMENLDILREARLDPAVYAPLKGTVTSKADAIKAFKADYIAENVWSWWNFIGMKRWNVDADWQITLSHTIDGKTFTLKPESQYWVFPFPGTVRDKNPDMTWNKVK